MADEPYDYGELLVIGHGRLTGPDALTDTLEGRAGKRPFRTADLEEGDEVPALDERTRGVLVLGGFPSVVEGERPGWVAAELDLLRTALEREVPVFGICLGAQLLAVALGGQVRRRATPEAGLPALTRTAEAADGDEVFAGWPDGGQVVLMHEDEIDPLPDGAIPMLEGSDGVPAWRAPDGISYGVQFHPEVSAAGLERWLATDKGAATCEASGTDPTALLEEAYRRERFLRAVGVALVGRWLDGVVGADDPTPRKPR